jgi:hypothetical protein
LKSRKLAPQIGDLPILLRDLLAELLIFLLKEIMAAGQFFAPRRSITR